MALSAEERRVRGTESARRYAAAHKAEKAEGQRRRRAAHPEYDRQWNAANRERIRELGREWDAAHREQEAERSRKNDAAHHARMAPLRALGCVDCGSRTDLHFHHLDPSTKLRDVSGMKGASDATFQAEVAKYVVVCQSCHMARHRLMRAVA